MQKHIAWYTKTVMVTENKRLSALQTRGFRQRTLCNLMYELNEVTYLETMRDSVCVFQCMGILPESVNIVGLFLDISIFVCVYVCDRMERTIQDSLEDTSKKCTWHHSHYNSTHIGAFTVRGCGKTKLLFFCVGVVTHCPCFIMRVGFSGVGRAGWALTGYLALAEELSILRTAWVIASRSIP